MAGLDNRWSPTADDAGPVVTGLVRVGDALVHTNPTLTQGISLALGAAERVVETAHRTTRHEEFAGSYDRWAHTALKPWFDLQVAADKDNERRLSGTAGAPMDEEARQKAARFPCALEDPLVMRAWAQARHMVRTPDEAFGSASSAGCRTAPTRHSPPRGRRAAAGSPWSRPAKRPDPGAEPHRRHARRAAPSGAARRAWGEGQTA
ncbi:hypothetical protein RB196_34830 [Streptomyces sp. PmtA]|uniref:hypothetical protein n=1 Tax=Streptomyces sp. PmtA TaxID=3074275 RepID=UPI0030156E58